MLKVARVSGDRSLLYRDIVDLSVEPPANCGCDRKGHKIPTGMACFAELTGGRNNWFPTSNKVFMQPVPDLDRRSMHQCTLRSV